MGQLLGFHCAHLRLYRFESHSGFGIWILHDPPPRRGKRPGAATMPALLLQMQAALRRPPPRSDRPEPAPGRERDSCVLALRTDRRANLVSLPPCPGAEQSSARRVRASAATPRAPGRCRPTESKEAAREDFFEPAAVSSAVARTRSVWSATARVAGHAASKPNVREEKAIWQL